MAKGVAKLNVVGKRIMVRYGFYQLRKSSLKGRIRVLKVKDQGKENGNGNQRYMKQPKSSLDEEKTFESLEKEIKDTIRLNKEERKSCSRCGKSKKRMGN